MSRRIEWIRICKYSVIVAAQLLRDVAKSESTINELNGKLGSASKVSASLESKCGKLDAEVCAWMRVWERVCR